MAPPYSRAPVAPQILELPLLLAVMGFSASLMGLSGHDIVLFARLRDKATINNLVTIEDNGIRTVDVALLAISSVAFAFSLVALVLACCQFPKRRGERTGKGTYAYVLTGLVLLILSGAYAGIAAAYTAYSVMKTMTFGQGPAYREPFTVADKTLLRSIYNQFAASQSAVTPYGTTQQLSALGEWANIDTLAQANAYLRRNNYLHYRTYRATVAVSWVTLATVFFVMVVHFALPYVLKALGMTRPPKEEEDEVKRRKQMDVARVMGERRSHRGYQEY
ncbi:uncharacterized protein PFL1_04906 [Pseudozyma flocculosa PF-1]|uniref:Uncharacterized protein n=2 Tax=Pseudozyma flocculosa TaxID=84751 RepID=A0A5C3EV96_9BASI|nr:uncharacterized protein PFL1_04906 [Pseudozyma flocculosa PF-1]EPQ27367.1 hypothetical protein PFL1_04906 [Pseudozyma flocculosa PF-1]SPO36218.1 uncharacterized protein PSFLO_01689 [Pseudozyma flocculosa]